VSDGKAHSKLGASSYYRWKACPGSVAASVGIPNESSVYAAEGTLAHDIASRLLLAQPIKDDVDEEMMDAIQIYLDHIQSLRAQKPTFESVEQKLNLSKYHPELFGTADYVCYFAPTKTLHVVDYKHGRGIPVDVVGSHQLMYYGLGALHMNAFPIDKVVLTIVQPRCYHPQGSVRSWETDGVEMIDFAAQLIDDAIATEKQNAELVAGDHCRFCPAQPTCTKPREQALAVVQGAFKDESSLPAIAPEMLAKYLEKIPAIKSWCEAVHKYAHQQAELGNTPPGWKLVDKRANRSWGEGVDAFILSQALEKDESKFFGEPKLLSPAQVEKLLTKDQKKILETFVVKASSGKTLVQSINDERPPVKGAIENMFTTE